MLRAALDVSWRSHISNKELYGPLPQVSAVVRSRRLRLAGHVVRHEEMAGQVLLWEPNEPRRRGRPSATLRKLMLEETGLEANELRSVMLDRNEWRHRCHLQEDELN
uniref:Uncharacterized protein n=1 Tax=Branchiostoma floridae TaxID=7739 RepID=C3Y6G4_BRAFL|eukprot:XP_002607914.1 hypothetical protein BRAFLDRAFT_74864 [Branchiostoma floridae]